MSALASVDPTELVAVPAPTQTRPVPVHDLRPWDRIAFRAPTRDVTEPDDDGPHLVWPRTLPADLPDPAQWCGALVRTCVEVLLGARPPAQLARWLTGDLFGSLSRRAIVGQSMETAARRVRVVRVHTCTVDEAHHEASVVFHDGRRVRAAAIRIEVYRGRWRATALEIG